MEVGLSFRSTLNVRQCGVVCEDGVELMGLSSQYDAPLDRVVLFLPGQFDNAYQQRKNHALLEECARRNLPCVLANTRGQDYFGYQRVYPASPKGSDFDFNDYRWQLYGSTFERVNESGGDIAAWIRFCLTQYRARDVVLLGHSHGAIKAANFVMAQSPGERLSIAGVGLLSPSDDIGGQQAKLGNRYDEAVGWARDRTEAGQADELMPDWAYSAPMSCGTYLEAFGADSPLRTFLYAEPQRATLNQGRSWSYPTLTLFGSSDAATATVSPTRACELITVWLDHAEVSTSVVDGANHHYRGHEDEVAGIICSWAVNLPSGG